MTTRLLLVMLAGVMAALTPAAFASPPDSGLAGLHDNADFDDIILAVMACIATLESPPSHDDSRLRDSVLLVLPSDASRPGAPQFSSSPIRAPPTS